VESAWGTFAASSRGRGVSLRHKLRVVLAVVAVSALSGIAATLDARAAGPTVGMITKVENQAQVGGVPAAVGSPVHMGDPLSTGARARLQVTFATRPT
jgi:hypothetical protein